MKQFYIFYQQLIQDKKLSSTEILALILIYNRYLISLHNPKFHNQHDVYVIYTYEQLAHDVHTSTRTIARLIKRLVKDNYITTELSANKHHSYIYLTSKSKQIINIEDHHDDKPQNNENNGSSNFQSFFTSEQTKRRSNLNNNNNNNYYNIDDDENDQDKKTQSTTKDEQNNYHHKVLRFYQHLQDIGLNKSALNVLFNYCHHKISKIYHYIHLMIVNKGHFCFEELTENLTVFLVNNLPYPEPTFCQAFKAFCTQTVWENIQNQSQPA